MTFFPIELLKYKINIPKNELLSCLSNNVEPKNIFHWSSYGKPYFGEIYENGFKIMRHSIIKNCFRPIIIGSIKCQESELFLEILMRPYIGVIIFICLFLGLIVIFFPLFVSISLVIEVKNIIFGLVSFIGTLIISTIIAGIIYIIMVLFFKFETKQSKILFNELCGSDNLEEEKNIKKLIIYVIKCANCA